jgi:hypothetical protein
VFCGKIYWKVGNPEEIQLLEASFDKNADRGVIALAL